jgi:hypothetical protein
LHFSFSHIQKHQQPTARINPPEDNYGTDKLMMKAALFPVGLNELVGSVANQATLHLQFSYGHLTHFTA